MTLPQNVFVPHVPHIILLPQNLINHVPNFARPDTWEGICLQPCVPIGAPHAPVIRSCGVSQIVLYMTSCRSFLIDRNDNDA